MGVPSHRLLYEISLTARRKRRGGFVYRWNVTVSGPLALLWYVNIHIVTMSEINLRNVASLLLQEYKNLPESEISRREIEVKNQLAGLFI